MCEVLHTSPERYGRRCCRFNTAGFALKDPFAHSQPRRMVADVTVPESFMRVLADYEPYPADENAEYAVCYFLESGSVWVFVPAPDRPTADSILRSISGRSEGVLTVSIETGPNAGRTSPVVWIARRHSEWRRIKSTEGADQYVGESR
jgi:hypothetical protein